MPECDIENVTLSLDHRLYRHERTKRTVNAILGVACHFTGM